MELDFKAKLWRWESTGAAWYFFSLPKVKSKLLKQISPLVARGWGSIRVEATIGSSVWKTSVFPQEGGAQYLLPVKAQIRKTEKLSEGETVLVKLTVLN